MLTDNKHMPISSQAQVVISVKVQRLGRETVKVNNVHRIAK